MEISNIKISELSELSDIDKPVISRYFKGASDKEITRVNNRIIGIYPDAAAKFLNEHGIDYFNKGAIIALSNLCGGVGKTTGTYSLAAGLRRVTFESDPIVLNDTDAQASFTKSICGSAASDQEPILIDFLEGKAKVQDILTPLGKNMWFIKSNLNQIYLDKVLSGPADIKKGMLKFYQQLFDYLGPKTKVFQDHTPQLSNIFASSVCALHEMDKNLIRAVVVPMRSDDYASDGAEKILNEIFSMQETFNLNPDIDIHCYFSSIDKRISTTAQAIKSVKDNEKIMQHLSPAVIRYCAEIPKSIQSSNNIYSSGKSNKAAEDFQYLLKSIFSTSKESEDE